MGAPTSLASANPLTGTKCELGNGEKLVEGNFITEDVPKRSLQTVLQKAEIITCVRTGAEVSLKCTGQFACCDTGAYDACV